MVSQNKVKKSRHNLVYTMQAEGCFLPCIIVAAYCSKVVLVHIIDIDELVVYSISRTAIYKCDNIAFKHYILRLCSVNKMVFIRFIPVSSKESSGKSVQMRTLQSLRCSHTPQELEVRSLYHIYSLKTKSSRCHYAVITT